MRITRQARCINHRPLTSPLHTVYITLYIHDPSMLATRAAAAARAISLAPAVIPPIYYTICYIDRCDDRVLQEGNHLSTITLSIFANSPLCGLVHWTRARGVLLPLCLSPAGSSAFQAGISNHPSRHRICQPTCNQPFPYYSYLRPASQPASLFVRSPLCLLPTSCPHRPHPPPVPPARPPAPAARDVVLAHSDNSSTHF